MKRHRGESGAAMIEAALLLPLLIVILLGIIEFGRAFNTQISIQSAAREGARALALGQNAVNAAISSSPSANLTASDVATSGTCPTNPTASDVATVTITKTIHMKIPFAFDIDKTLKATAKMRCGA